ncbi:MAG: hypothetical protein HY649_04730 [Acidobacteria bacterium]|nr:hypothetical protein [Acidobacteriota bacterium]
MLSFRMAVLPMILFLLAAQQVTPAHAQQRGERRVFTNEDVERPAPAAETAAAESAEPAEPTEAADSAESRPGPQGELKWALDLQATLKDAYEAYLERLDNETIEARKLRWEIVVNSLNAVVQYNQMLINELQGEPQASGEAAP